MVLFYRKNEKLFMVCFSFAEVSLCGSDLGFLNLDYFSFIFNCALALLNISAGATRMGIDNLALQLSF